MNAFAECDCLRRRQAEVGRLAGDGRTAQLRETLEAMLRCAARHGCRLSVDCSDEARAGIARLLVG